MGVRPTTPLHIFKRGNAERLTVSLCMQAATSSIAKGEDGDTSVQKQPNKEVIKMQVKHNDAALDVCIETITPEKAHEYLSRSNGKQTKGRSGVSRYAESMNQGRWRLTGEPVIFNSKGELDNGYSRLEACVLSGCPFTTLVVRGIEAKAFDVLDIGKSRSLADLLRFKGKEYVCIVAYIAKRLAARDKGISVGSSSTVTRQEEMDAVRKYPEIEDYARNAQALGKGLPHSLLAFVWYLFGKEYPTKMQDFFRAFSPKDGDTLNRKHLASQLREILSVNTLTKVDRTRYAFRAINGFLAGEHFKLSKGVDESTNILHIGTSGKTITIA